MFGQFSWTLIFHYCIFNKSWVRWQKKRPWLIHSVRYSNWNTNSKHTIIWITSRLWYNIKSINGLFSKIYYAALSNCVVIYDISTSLIWMETNKQRLTFKLNNIVSVRVYAPVFSLSCYSLNFNCVNSRY